ncbi:hypothetical protein [Methylomonas albis]|nr:hypothetical protein [Methylomonas albis]
MITATIAKIIESSFSYRSEHVKVYYAFVFSLPKHGRASTSSVRVVKAFKSRINRL